MAAETEVLFIRGKEEDTEQVPRTDGQLIVEMNNTYTKGNLATDVLHNGTVSRILIAGSEAPVVPTADDIDYDNTSSHLSATNVQDAIDEVVNDIDEKTPVPVSYTILASGWSNSIYSFESIYSSEDYDIVNILTNDTTTDAQRDAWVSADCGGYRATNTIKAHGDVPEIDIPVTLVVVHK